MERGLDNSNNQSYLDMTADIISAYVSNNAVRHDDLPALIASVHASLKAVTAPKVEDPADVALVPAVPIRKSVTDDYLICLEDGKMFKSLKRHLMSSYQMTPEDYRAKWKLPKDYPMVAPGYAATRSALAKQIGLGRKGRPSGYAESAPEAAAAPIPEPANDIAPTKRRAAAKRAAPVADAVDAPAAKQPAKRRGRPKKVVDLAEA